MATVTNAQIRLWGAAERAEIAAAYFHHGDGVGLRAARRFIYENAVFVAEIHGREQAAALCYALGDKVLSGSVPHDPKLDGAAQEPAAARAAAASQSPPDIGHFIKDRSADAKEWLRRNAPELVERSLLDLPLSDRGLWRLGYLAALLDMENLAQPTSVASSAPV